MRSNSAARRRPPHDPTIYPEEEKVGEHALQRWLVTALLPLIARYLREQGVRAFVGADQFFYWRQHDSSTRVAPDVYVMPGVDPAARPSSWKLWETDVRPSFALEVVSQDWEKDYATAPLAYRAIDAGELVVFDPFAPDEGGERIRWQVWRKLPRRGFVRVERTGIDRVFSRALGCWLVAVGRWPGDVQIRLATGRAGEVLVPTDEERAEEHAKRADEAARRADEAARRADERAEVAAEQARRADAAEAEVARLRAQLARAGARSPSKRPRKR